MNLPNETLAIALGGAATLLLSSFVLTKSIVARKDRDRIRARLDSLLASKNQDSQDTEIQVKLRLAPDDESRNATRTDGTAGTTKTSAINSADFHQHLKRMHSLSGISMGLSELIQTSLLIALITATLPFALDLAPAACLLGALLIPVAAYLLVRLRAENMRNKFITQLPNSIDLMVSILKSGHSIPQAVRSVAEESPQPCMTEFTQIFNRMNLGQSLPEAMQKSVEKYDSFELDLIRRASSLHQEVGGSLSEVLEKTNETLRQRIKLKNQIAVMTTQGKLSAWICALLPIVVAIAFSQMNPDYLSPLLSSTTGQLMLAAALFLELAGFLIMHKLASFRI